MGRRHCNLKACHYGGHVSQSALTACMGGVGVGIDGIPSGFTANRAAFLVEVAAAWRHITRHRLHGIHLWRYRWHVKRFWRRYGQHFLFEIVATRAASPNCHQSRLICRHAFINESRTLNSVRLYQNALSFSPSKQLDMSPIPIDG